jgi:hypothetical protein
MGQIVINTTSNQDVRLAHCFGVYLNFDPPRDATPQEVKHCLTKYLEDTVHGVENNEKREQYASGYVPPDPINIVG